MIFSIPTISKIDFITKCNKWIKGYQLSNNNGLEDENIGQMVDEYGTKWNPVVRTYKSNW